MKINATDPNWPRWRKYLYPCDCGDTDWLYIQWWDDDPDDHAYLEVVPAIWAAGWWDRLKAIGRIIAGQPHYHGGIILNRETVERLRETLDELELNQEKGKEEDKDGKAERTNEDEHIHQDTDT